MTRNTFLAVVVWQFIVGFVWAFLFLDGPFFWLWIKCISFFGMAMAPLVYMAWVKDRVTKK